MQQQQLINAGGQYWEGGAHRRVYFNDLAEVIGFDSGYKIDGEYLSKTQQRKIESNLMAGKVFYDLNKNEFISNLPGKEDIKTIGGYRDFDLRQTVIDAIQSRINE